MTLTIELLIAAMDIAVALFVAFSLSADIKRA